MASPEGEAPRQQGGALLDMGFSKRSCFGARAAGDLVNAAPGGPGWGPPRPRVGSSGEHLVAVAPDDLGDVLGRGDARRRNGWRLGRHAGVFDQVLEAAGREHPEHPRALRPDVNRWGTSRGPRACWPEASSTVSSP